jgi:hypothetical protein
MSEYFQNSKKNRGGLVIVFFPIILFSFIFLLLDNFFQHKELVEYIYYFQNLYLNRSIVFLFILIFWNFLKSMISGYLLLIIVYAFNILIVVSDNMNISNMRQELINFSESNFYRMLIFKEIFNFIFLIEWIILLLVNLKAWYTLYTERETILDENEGTSIKSD